jgi:hypothetical protein
MADNEQSRRLQRAMPARERTSFGISWPPRLLEMIEHYSAKIERPHDNEKPHCHAIDKNARRPLLARPGLVSDRPFS